MVASVAEDVEGGLHRCGNQRLSAVGLYDLECGETERCWVWGTHTWCPCEESLDS